MFKSKKAKLKLSLKQKFIVNALNKALKPFEKGYAFFKNSAFKVNEKFPAVYRHFEGLVKQHIITPSKELFKSSKIEDMGSFITANVIKRLPHVDESHVEEILSNPSNKSFLEILTEGFGINKDKEKTYTVLGNGGFKKILIANRGEIALRVIRACRELGIESVVIYSEKEKDSLAVKFADKSYTIGKPRNYLNIKKIIKIAKQFECDAIHPGYGFLAENPALAAACEDAGITLIGPSAASMEAMGVTLIWSTPARALNTTSARAGGSTPEIRMT